ncbi:lipid A3-O-deacylase [Haloferula helveola]|uniref:Lipid A3-O-deacylase n=1 Tax=Haloferula helveola TaxID=490095 RepID=A0ABM7RDD4_9BACT|nr:lipid A3-O-deacylase [Haloferula helveola]
MIVPLIVCSLPLADLETPAPAVAHPAEAWELTLESGYAWNVGSNTPIDYQIIPTQLTLRTPVQWSWWEDEHGARLVVRSRFSLMMEVFAAGPETGYLGLSAAPSIEYWFPDEKTSLFFSIGGGIGMTDSTNVPGGQGQDFTLNWFAHLGLRREIGENVSLLGGPYFVHHSNGGQTSPNPGIDALGFTIGVGWRF